MIKTLSAPITIAMLLISSSTFSQSIMLQKKASPSLLEKYVKKASVFSLNKSVTKKISAARPSQIEIDFEFEGKIWTLELTEHRVFSKGFFVKDGYNKPVAYDINKGIHFKGKVKGLKNSIASVNIYENEMNAIIADNNGNINIGPLNNSSNDMVIYRDANLVVKPSFECEAVPPGETNNNPLPAP